MTNDIPWVEFEGHYASLYSKEQGALAMLFCLTLGTLIIKEKLNITDEATVEQIWGTPYSQYLVGFNKYQDKRHLIRILDVTFFAQDGNVRNILMDTWLFR